MSLWDPSAPKMAPVGRLWGALGLAGWGPRAPRDAPEHKVKKVQKKSLFRMRKWMPGDRVRLSYGSKKLKKIFGEIRVPVDERSKVPVVVDGHDRVLWVPGISRSCLLVPIKGENELSISLSTPEIT